MKLKKLLGIVGVLILAVAIVGVMVMSRSKTQRSVVEEKPIAVEVYEITKGPWPAVISATGLVSPAREIELSPQVTGSIVWISDKLMPGGRFKKGDVLARIDARDFQIALAQEESKLRAAQLDLEREKARQGIAKKEWDILGKGRDDSSFALALRKPQLAVAALRAKAAQSGLSKAKLNLERTRLVAPFDAAVVAETVDVGQLVGPATRVARLMGTDEFWVTVALPVAALRWIETEAVGKGSPVTVTQNIGQDKETKRMGRVLQVVTQLNAQTRRAQVLVSIERPMDPEKGLPMLAGAFVSVEIEGSKVAGALKVPRVALRDGHVLWLVRDNKLKRIQIAPLWTTEEAVFVDGGLAAGDQVVVSPLSLPVEGMKVAVQSITPEVTDSPNSISASGQPAAEE